MECVELNFRVLRKFSVGSVVRVVAAALHGRVDVIEEYLDKTGVVLRQLGDEYLIYIDKKLIWFLAHELEAE